MPAKFDGRAFLADLHVLEKDIQHSTGEAMKYAVEGAEQHARSTRLFNDGRGRTLVDKDGLRLRDSISSWHTTTRGELSANSRHARFVNSGTPKHRIPGNPLTFRWHGVQVFFRFVNHPGTKPRPFMDQAAAFGKQELEDKLDSFVEESIRKFNAK